MSILDFGFQILENFRGRQKFCGIIIVSLFLLSAPALAQEPPPTLTPTPRATRTTPVITPTIRLDVIKSNPSAPTPTPIPPVTITSVLTPDRLLWLFLIGVVVFTASYGIQVIIWYRLKR